MAARKKKNLVIVESPAKAKTINKYLGADFEVAASKGHVRDLPKSKFGIDIEDGWVPTYQILKDRKDVLSDAEEAGRQGGHRLPGPRPRPRGRGHRLAPEGSPGPRRRPRPPRHLQRDHQDGDPGGVRPPRPDRHGPGQRPGGAAVPRPRRRLPAQPAAVPEGGPRPERRPRAVGRRPADRRARTRDRRRSSRKNTGRSPPRCARGHGASRRRAKAHRQEGQAQAKKPTASKDDEDGAEPEPPQSCPKAPSSPSWPSGRARSSRPTTRTRPTQIVDALKRPTTSSARSSRRTAQEKAARRRSPPARCSSRRASGCATPAKKTMMIAQRLYEGVELGGEGSVALITYMRTDSVRVSRRGPEGVSASIIKKQLRRARTCPTKPNRYASGKRPRKPTRRSGRPTWPTRRRRSAKYLPQDQLQALHADLQPLRRQPDDAGGLRRHQRRGQGGRGRLQGPGQDPEVRRLPHACCPRPASRKTPCCRR